MFEALLGRRSCRHFLARPVEQEKIMKILECAIFAPSPANKQPWEFVVTSNPKYNHELKAAVEVTKGKLAERSGWKWLPSFSVDFLLEAPVLIVVNGDPERNGAEQFLDEPGKGYEHGCCAAIENMLIAAHGLGLATLWFSMFEKRDVRKIFGVDKKLDPVAIICLGYTDVSITAPARKDFATKVKFLE
ncbi:MAG: nitroreductase family protein [Negativicutes bacterium]|nr:nitroreductase family protein [Negativicutes bacterium]